jgi:hypothetical protein
MRIVLLSAALLLVGCKDHRPPAPTAEEASQLNETEDMLNNMAGNEEGPTDQGRHQSSTLMGTRSAGPSNDSN